MVVPVGGVLLASGARSATVWSNLWAPETASGLRGGAVAVPDGCFRAQVAGAKVFCRNDQKVGRRVARGNHCQL